MKFLFITACVLITGGFAHNASSQVISQTPRPDIPDDAETLVETVKPQARIGQSGTIIQVPRAGALLFAGFDRNDDYIIDQAEVNAGISRAFVSADKDKSGVLSLVELEGWRVAALGSEHAAPTNFTFAPDFARTVTKDKFVLVLTDLAARLDQDDQGEQDGQIAMADLFRNYSPPRARKDVENCAKRVREERRRAEQQCRSGRRY